MITILLLFSTIAHLHIVGIVSQRHRDEHTNENCSIPITTLPIQIYGHSKGITIPSPYTNANGQFTFNATCPLGTHLSIAWSNYYTGISNATDAIPTCNPSVTPPIYVIDGGYYFDHIDCIGTVVVIKF